MKTKCFGLWTRRERWGLSARGWLVFIFSLLALALVWMLNVHPFLAQTQRVETKVLVVEGWVHSYVIQAAVKEFQAGGYTKIYTTGGPITGTDGATNIFNTSASVGAERLVKAGIPADCLEVVPAQSVGRDRTYTSARALRNFFAAKKLDVRAFNVLTEDAHARRTRGLFQRAFGAEATVGVIAVPNPDYEPSRWWRYSEGVREILGESIAWLYAVGWFRPGPEPQVP